MDGTPNPEKKPEENAPKRRLYQTPAFKKGLFIFLVLASVLAFAIAVFRLDTILAVIDRIIGYIMPIFYGIAMAYLLNPVVVFLDLRFAPFLAKRCKTERKAKKISKALSITLAVLFGITLITVLCVMIIPELVYSLTTLAKSLPGELERVIDFLRNGIDTEVFWGETLKNFIDNAFNAFNNWITTGLPELAGNMLTYLTDSVIGIVGFLVNFFIGIVVAVYVLCDKDKFRGQAKKLLFAFCKPKTANMVIDTARHGHEIFGGFLTGKIIDSLIVGIVNAIFMLITGMPYVVLISVLVGVTNIIPFFGPFIGAIPSGLLILLIDPLKALYFVLFILALQQFDGNILGPKILGDSTGLSSFWVMFAILLAGGLFGFVGMVVGVPLFAVLYSILSGLVSHSLRRRGMPEETQAYYELDHVDERTHDILYNEAPARPAAGSADRPE